MRRFPGGEVNPAQIQQRPTLTRLRAGPALTRNGRVTRFASSPAGLQINPGHAHHTQGRRTAATATCPQTVNRHPYTRSLPYRCRHPKRTHTAYCECAASMHREPVRARRWVAGAGLNAWPKPQKKRHYPRTGGNQPVLPRLQLTAGFCRPSPTFRRHVEIPPNGVLRVNGRLAKFPFL